MNRPGAEREDLYALLGVPPAADAPTIQKAYRERARELHPDVNASPDAAARFAQVQHAYELLSDPERRRAYDDGVAAADDPRMTYGGGPVRPTYAWESIAARRGGAKLRDRKAGDAGDPTGFEELYSAIFAPRAGKPKGTKPGTNTNPRTA